jgi:hypothetical protein
MLNGWLPTAQRRRTFDDDIAAVHVIAVGP